MSIPKISIQLWTVKDELEADPDATLARLGEIGFTVVEAYGFVKNADELAVGFERHGLRAETGHASLASDSLNPFQPDAPAPPQLDEVFAAAKKLGMTTVIDPYVSEARWNTREGIADTAARLNAAAIAAAPHGITVGYHNHGHEIESKIDGTIALEVLAEYLDPAVVLELDLYWAAAGGADVPALVRRLGDRVVAAHVKDGKLDPLPSTREIPTNQLPAGDGGVPLTAALDAATNLRYAIVEFDTYGGDIWEGVAASREFLVARGLS
jgi:sugar phosphate isomerase/epimerase